MRPPPDSVSAPVAPIVIEADYGEMPVKPTQAELDQRNRDAMELWRGSRNAKLMNRHYFNLRDGGEIEEWSELYCEPDPDQ